VKLEIGAGRPQPLVEAGAHDYPAANAIYSSPSEKTHPRAAISPSNTDILVELEALGRHFVPMRLTVILSLQQTDEVSVSFHAQKPRRDSDENYSGRWNFWLAGPAPHMTFAGPAAHCELKLR
jgi:hypothetical protein